MSLSLRYVHKQLDRAIEDIGNLDAEGNETYVIGNPGEGPNATYVTPGEGRVIALPKAVRDYDAVELSLNKRMANHWSSRASYMWSRLNGNYPGLSQSDENGRTSPNIGRSFDYPLMMFNEQAEAVMGVLPTDRTHQVKLQMIYDAPFGVSVGGNWFLASGIPMTREAAYIAGSNYPIQYLGRNSDGRTPFFNQLDLFAEYELKLGGRNRLSFNANFINVLGSSTEHQPVAHAAAAEHLDRRHRGPVLPRREHCSSSSPSRGSRRTRASCRSVRLPGPAAAAPRREVQLLVVRGGAPSRPPKPPRSLRGSESPSARGSLPAGGGDVPPEPPPPRRE